VRRSSLEVLTHPGITGPAQMIFRKIRRAGL
jgi:hypothetical protein